MCSCPLFMFVRIPRRLFAPVAPSLAPKEARSRFRRPLTRLREFARSTWSHSVGAVACSEDYSVHLPIMGCWAARSNQGATCPITCAVRHVRGGVLPEKKISVGWMTDISFAQ